MMNSNNNAVEKQEVLGVVLSGGQSTRMGTDKGLMVLEGLSWVARAAGLLQEVCREVVVSVRIDQYKSYRSVVTDHELIMDDDSIPVKGPLHGLFSVHARYPEKDLLVLACDLVQMQSLILLELLKHYRENHAYEAFAFLNEGQPEPLCAIYKAEGMTRMLKKYISGEAERFSMKYLLSALHLMEIPLPPGGAKYFLNINSPRDLHSL